MKSILDKNNKRNLPIIKLIFEGALTIFIFFMLFVKPDFLYGQSQTYTSTGTFAPPAGVTSVTVECWGGGGSGGGSTSNNVKGGGGGAGGAYAKKILTVIPGNSYTVTVGATKTGTTGAGALGNPSWFGSVSTVYAEGGQGGAAPNNTTVNGGTGSSANSIGDIVYSGGNGATGTTSRSGAGGGGAGSTGNGGNANGTTAGSGTTIGGGNGGSGRTSENDGNNGSTYGGGGSGAFLSDNTDHTGGSGAAGRVIVSWSCPSYSLTSVSATRACTSSGSSTVTLTSSITGLPVGTYTVTYSRSLPSGTGLTATMTVSTAGSGSFTATGFTSAGTSTLTITSLASGGCSTTLTSNNTATMAVSSSSPSQPSTISGSTSPCSGSSQSYSVTNVTNTVYTWSFPSGWVQTSGGNSNSVIVTVGSGSGTISVTPSNGCGSGTARTLAVSVSPVPAQPSVVTGSVNPCSGSSQVYSVTNVSGVTYSWAFPSDWTVTAGGSTNSVTVTVGLLSGDIQVTPSNTCGSGTSRILTAGVSPSPAAPASVIVNPSSINYGDPGPIILTSSGGGGDGATLRWYSGTCGTGTLIGTGSPLSISAPTSTTTYYARWENGTCSSECQSATLTVIPPATLYRSKATGNWNSASSWEISNDNGTSWTNASATPSSANGSITIRNSHVITVTSGVTVDQAIIDAGGKIAISASGSPTLTIADGTGDDLINNGTIEAQYQLLVGGGNLSINGSLVNNNSILIGGGILYFGNLNINAGGRLKCSPSSTVTGAGNFDLKSGGSIEIGAAAGISALGTNTGNIQTTNTRNFNTAANYIYTGTSSQQTGNGLPSTVNSLQINNTASTPSVTLTNSVTVSSSFTLSSGLFTLGTNNLTLSQGCTLDGTPGDGNMVVTNSTGKMIRYINQTGNYLFPVGSVTNVSACSPVTFQISSGTFSNAHIDVMVKDVTHPQNPSGTDYLKRYWSVSQTGISGLSYNAEFGYSDFDVNGNETQLAPALYSSSSWTFPTGSVNSSLNTISFTGLSSTGDFTAAGGFAVSISPVSASVCSGNPITLTAIPTGGSGTYTNYLWSPGSWPNSSTITATPGTTTEYTVVVTDSQGHQATASCTVSVTPGPEANAGPDLTIVQGSAVTITQATASGSPILWTSTGQGLLANETTLNPTYTPSSEETAPVTLILTVGESPCVSSDEMIISLIPIHATWTGNAYDLNWHSAQNWDGNAVPGSVTDVVIPSGLWGNYPIVSSPASCNNLSLQSDASIIETGNLQINGTSSIERIIPGDNTWHFLSSPVAVQPIWPEFTPSPAGDPLAFESAPWNWDLYYWNPNANMTTELYWVNIRQDASGIYNNSGIEASGSDAGFGPASAGNPAEFKLGRGYLVAYDATWPQQTHSFTGSLNSGLISKSITLGANPYNLLGNPYPSSIDWQAAAGWDRNSLLLNGSGYDYWIWNDADGSYGAFNSSYPEGSGTHGADRYIAPTQGFFVQASSSGILSMTDEIRAHSAQPWLKSMASSSKFLHLRLSNGMNRYNDELTIIYDPASITGGTAKWWSFYAEAPELYVQNEDLNYSIARLNNLDTDVSLNVNLKIGLEGIYTLTASDVSDYPVNKVILEDLKTGAIINLKQQPGYSFTASPDDNAARFRLKLGSPAGFDDEQQNMLRVFASGNTIQIMDMQAEYTYDVNISNIAGQQLIHRRLQNTANIRIETSLTPGIYIVTVKNNQNIFSHKIVIR